MQSRTGLREPAFSLSAAEELLQYQGQWLLAARTATSVIIVSQRIGASLLALHET